MLSSKAPNKKPRNPSRSTNAARVSIAWDVYDRLDKLATAENASITEVTRGLLDKYEEIK
jgi:predicted CopG family antitoxin